MLEQRQQQRLALNQKLSPQQIQFMKMLEIPCDQLEARIKEECENNPMLGDESEELPEDKALDDASRKTSEEQKDLLSQYPLFNDSVPDYRLAVNNRSADEPQEEIPISEGESLHESLKRQFGLSAKGELQHRMGEYLIGHIDDDGYLRRDLESVADAWFAATNQQVEMEQWEAVLSVVQELEPAGVGARSVQECLLLQLRNKQQTETVVRAVQVLSNYFEEFITHHFNRIMQRMSLSADDMKQIREEVLKLNPRPGGSSSTHNNLPAARIVPDFMLEKDEKGLMLSLNARNVPRLKCKYVEQLQDLQAKPMLSSKEKSDLAFMRSRLEAAQWRINAMKQRQQTLMSTMQAIVDYQEEFFLSAGDETKLVPMILKNIADMTNLDISTISRVANSKYIQTYFGLYPLKFFFSEGLQTQTGEEVSTRGIKQILKQAIENEAKDDPLTDDQLTDLLKEKGYQIARRTVAKYREQLGISKASLRKDV